MSIPKPPPSQGGGRRRATIIGVVIALLALIGVVYGVGQADGAVGSAGTAHVTAAP